MGATRELFDRAVEAENNGDFQAMALVYATDAVRIGPDQTVRGRDAILEFYRRGREMVPDWHVTLDRILEQDDWIAWDGVLTGTNTGPLHLPTGGTLPPTGRRQELHCAGFAQFRDGQCVFLRLYFDQLEARRQLGFAPTPAPAIAGMVRGVWESRVAPRLRDRRPRSH